MESKKETQKIIKDRIKVNLTIAMAFIFLISFITYLAYKAV